MRCIAILIFMVQNLVWRILLKTRAPVPPIFILFFCCCWICIFMVWITLINWCFSSLLISFIFWRRFRSLLLCICIRRSFRGWWSWISFLRRVSGRSWFLLSSFRSGFFFFLFYGSFWGSFFLFLFNRTLSGSRFLFFFNWSLSSWCILLYFYWSYRDRNFLFLISWSF